MAVLLQGRSGPTESKIDNGCDKPDGQRGDASALAKRQGRVVDDEDHRKQFFPDIPGRTCSAA
jgi:hypothetical protein